VAFCGLYQYPTDPSTAFLALCGVIKDYRGYGLQKRMIRVRMQKAKQLGVTRVITYTSHDNAASANSLISSGFRLYVPRWEWGIRNGNYFRKFVS
jgi:RimJ/RimL family protein N-acetyltransferase